MGSTITSKRKISTFYEKYARAILLISLFLSWPIGIVITFVLLSLSSLNLSIISLILFSFLGGIILCLMLLSAFLIYELKIKSLLESRAVSKRK